MNRKLTYAVASVFLATTIPLGDSTLALPSRATQKAQQEQNPPSSEVPAQFFSGKITKMKGKYMLQPSKERTPYLLDDQETAKDYEGIVVMVTGTLDESKNIIHVQKIEAAA